MVVEQRVQGAKATGREMEKALEVQEEQEEAVVAHPLKMVGHPLKEAHLQMGQMVMQRPCQALFR